MIFKLRIIYSQSSRRTCDLKKHVGGLSLMEWRVDQALMGHGRKEFDSQALFE